MVMDDAARRILKLPDPWVVEGATVIEDRKEVEVRVTFKATKAPCPDCGRHQHSVPKRHRLLPKLTELAHELSDPSMVFAQRTLE